MIIYTSSNSILVVQSRSMEKSKKSLLFDQLNQLEQAIDIIISTDEDASTDDELLHQNQRHEDIDYDKWGKIVMTHGTSWLVQDQGHHFTIKIVEYLRFCGLNPPLITDREKFPFSDHSMNFARRILSIKMKQLSPSHYKNAKKPTINWL